ncbi:MAG: sensor histidine kinase [Anaerolineae bacterium]|nr:sensor histidine kinase [Anaerolineae bacterium]
MGVIKSTTQWARSLKGQMAISFLLVTLVSIFISELVIFGGILFSLTGENSLTQRVQRTATAYAQQLPAYFDETGQFATGFFSNTLEPDLNPGQITFNASGIVISYIDGISSAGEKVAVGLVLSPDFQILDSSYPSQYPIGGDLRQVLPESATLLADVQRDISNVAQFEMSGTTFLQTAVPIFSNTNNARLGYVHVHAPNLPAGANLLWGTALPLLIGAMLLMLLILPIGLLFGLFATRGPINRLAALTATTQRFAQGDFSQRIPIKRQDELGKLEKQFNEMAERIVESIARETELIAQKGAADERERISMELHDSLSQDVFSLNMLAGGLQEALPDEHPIQTQIRLLQNTIDHMIREMRALIIAMRPSLLEDHSFTDAIHSYINHYHRLNVNISAHVEEGLQLDPIKENALFRIAQESISNAVRHAEANKILLSLRSVGSNIILTIKDDGKGFSVEKAHPGFGLETMNGRVKALKGLVQIDSSPQMGTIVKVTIPHDRNC